MKLIISARLSDKILITSIFKVVLSFCILKFKWKNGDSPNVIDPNLRKQNLNAHMLYRITLLVFQIDMLV